jgi:hypothetical protein
MDSPIAPKTASARVTCDSRNVDLTTRVSIPENEIEIAYSPGGSAEKLYAPVSPVIVLRDPCNAGDVIVTVAPGSGSLNAFTTPASDAVVWPNTVAATRKKTHTNSAAHERFVILGLSEWTHQYCPKESDEAMPQSP